MSSEVTARPWRSTAVKLFFAAVVAGSCAYIVRAMLFPAVFESQPEEFRPVRFISPQPPTVSFPVKTTRQAIDLLEGDELVLGVTVGKESRAYPINMLNELPEHKVLNDTLGGKAIVATWCDRCFSGIVYSREMEGQTLTFFVDGRLWKDSLIMADRQTWTLWSQLLGEGKTGKWKGKSLVRIPSVLTDWGSWRREHSDGTVVILDRKHREFTTASLQGPRNLVLGIGSGEDAKAWDLNDLSATRVHNDSWNGTLVVAVFENQSGSARLFERTVDGKVLRFARDGERIKDETTGSVWSPGTGAAISGPMKGRRLTPLPAVVAYRSAWRQFHPKSQ